MTYSIGNPGPTLGQAQKCGRVKPVNACIFIHIILKTCLKLLCNNREGKLMTKYQKKIIVLMAIYVINKKKIKDFRKLI